MDIHSSSLQKAVNYVGKKFYSIGPWAEFSGLGVTVCVICLIRPSLKLKTRPELLLGPLPLDFTLTLLLLSMVSISEPAAVAQLPGHRASKGEWSRVRIRPESGGKIERKVLKQHEPSKFLTCVCTIFGRLDTDRRFQDENYELP
jgi:hypothetical protein